MGRIASRHQHATIGGTKGRGRQAIRKGNAFPAQTLSMGGRNELTNILTILIVKYKDNVGALGFPGFEWLLRNPTGKRHSATAQQSTLYEFPPPHLIGPAATTRRLPHRCHQAPPILFSENPPHEDLPMAFAEGKPCGQWAAVHLMGQDLRDLVTPGLLPHSGLRSPDIPN